MQTAIQQMIDFINDINDNDSTNFNYYYDSIITKLNELLEVEKQQISGAPELRYKDGTPIRKYNSPKLQAIEMENKQTAVEWLEQKAKEFAIDLNLLHYFEQAKEMEKEQNKKEKCWVIRNSAKHILCVHKTINDEQLKNYRKQGLYIDEYVLSDCFISINPSRYNEDTEQY